ncbi:hypothetical protein AB0H37_38340 [Actinomadura sp. NPDC023710]|uniref:hypothetical protein n=1 Tax=Actinomadura sp. NPDC023710 TaxID=3158219 RepID=UPI0033E6DEE5
MYLGAPLEKVMWRQWPDGTAAPSPVLVTAIRRLAALPESLKVELGRELHGIFVGPGGVPDLDSMEHLRDRVLPSGRGRWNESAGAYIARFVLIGDRPTPTPDVVLHELGHAFDHVRGGGQMLSDGALFAAVYQTCVPALTLPVHLLPDELGRREFFADAFAALGAGATVELLGWLGGERELLLLLVAYFRQQFPELRR